MVETGYNFMEIMAAIALGLIGLVVGIQKILKGFKGDAAETNMISLMSEELTRLSNHNRTLSEELAKFQIEVLNLNKQLNSLSLENQRLHQEVVSLTLEVSRLHLILKDKPKGK